MHWGLMKKPPEAQAAASSPPEATKVDPGAGLQPGVPPQPVVILAQTRFFCGLSEAQLQRAAQTGEIQAFERGRSVYCIGDPARALYVLVEGSVRLAIGMGNRHTSAGDILRRGDVFGWAALTPNSSRRIATASCLTDCTFLAIDGEKLRALMERDHTLGYRLMTHLVWLITGTLTAFAAG